jgi:hypothetical protein
MAHLRRETTVTIYAVRHPCGQVVGDARLRKDIETGWIAYPALTGIQAHSGASAGLALCSTNSFKFDYNVYGYGR